MLLKKFYIYIFHTLNGLPKKKLSSKSCDDD
jgi:hypothetical protein